MNLSDQSRAPIFEALERYKSMRIVPFDVPGHKRGKGNPELTKFLGEKCLTVDVNSMKPLDNLCHPVSVIKEAEEYDGPSIIIAYAPCINHGLKCGMGKSVNREKQAVAAGYWHLYRFDPRLEKEGKNPFVLDSKDPTESFQDFIGSEVRYTSLQKDFPEEAEILFKAAEESAKDRLASYKRMAGLDK